jgi:hypothetical protein
MSGKNNVNPDHYKGAGRDRQDDNARARRETPPSSGPRKKKREPAPNFIPGAAPVGEAPPDDEEREPEARRR